MRRGVRPGGRLFDGIDGKPSGFQRLLHLLRDFAVGDDGSDMLELVVDNKGTPTILY